MRFVTLTTAGALCALNLLFASPVFGEQTLVEAPCKDNESWTFSPQIPKETVATLESLLEVARKKDISLVTALQNLDASVELIRKNQHVEVKALGTYIIARTYLSTGYPHLAHSLFETTLLRPGSDAVGVKLGAVECLNALREKAPTLASKGELLPTYEALGQRVTGRLVGVLQQAEFYLLQQELRAKKPILASAYGLLAKPGPYGSLGRALIAQANGDTKASISQLTAFLAQEKNGAARYSDLALLLLARSYISMGQRTKAVVALKKIPPTSNYFPEVLSDLGELYAQKARYKESTDEFMNLQLGPMLRTFHPSAHVDLAFSLTELCQYPAAYRMLQGYQAKYARVRTFLDLVERQRATRTLYSRIGEFLTSEEAKRDSGQTTVVLEWMRSADFLANQLEINLLIDEKAASQAHFAQIKTLGGDKALGLGGKAFLKSLTVFARKIPSKEALLVANLEKKIQSTARVMRTILAKSDERASLLEADVLRLAGSQLIQPKTEAVVAEAKAKKENGAKLDWGRVPASELGSHEVWADELGSLKSLFENKCGK